MNTGGTIDLEGKLMTCTGGDLTKLSTPEGCSLKIVTDKVYSLDDNSFSDEDQEFDDSDFNQESKRDRMVREFLSLTLNSDRDPIKPGATNRIGKFVDDHEDDSENINAEYEFGQFGCKNISRKYRNLSNYEEMIKDPRFEEVSPGRVYKRRTMPGVGPLADENSLIIYNYAFWTEKGSEPYDSSWLRHKACVSNLQSDPILPGFRELLLTTRKGEWCEAFIRPEAAFGRLGAMPRIPPNATLFCLLEVTKVVPLTKIAALVESSSRLEDGSSVSFDDYYEASDEARRRGNYYYEAKQYKVALQRYKSGIRILEALTFKGEAEEEKAKSLLLKLYNNSAKAANAIGEPRLALGACKQALLLNELEPKAHWNRMMAWKKKGHLDRALGCARRAMQLFPDHKTNKSFQIEAAQLKKGIQNEEADLKKLYRSMGHSVSSSFASTS